MMRIVDYSFARPGGAAIKAAGFDGAMRYVPYPWDEGKGLTREEIADLHSNGVGVGLVFESTAKRHMDGAAAGRTDALIARQALDYLGFPMDRPVYFAVDFEATPAHYDRIMDYQRGAIEILGLQRVGIYGHARLLEHVRDMRCAAWYWQTLAWSYGALFPYRHLYQSLNGQVINGGEVDHNEAYGEDQGLWMPGGQEVTEEQIRAIFKEELAKAVRGDDSPGLVASNTFLTFLAQSFGLEKSTFTLQDGSPDPRVNELRDYIQAMAKGGVTAPLIYAKLAEALSAALDVMKKAAVGRES